MYAMILVSLRIDTSKIRPFGELEKPRESLIISGQEDCDLKYPGLRAILNFDRIYQGAEMIKHQCIFFPGAIFELVI
jgi:hypothetical protein